MLHIHRLHGPPLHVDDPATLAQLLVHRTWVVCQAFAWADLLLLNDSTSPDGASEWAIIKDGRQIETITFSWCTEQRALDYLLRLQAGTLRSDMGPLTPQFHPASRACAGCA